MSLILIIIFIFLSILFTYLLIGIINFNYRFPKNFTHNTISSKNISIHSTAELPTKIDTIIIGSGISGLSAASTLARSGQTVVLIEQHNIPGGWTHTYQVKGYTFDTGVHWLGGGSCEIFNLIGAKPFEWTRLDHENNNMIYYTRVINESQQQYKFPANLDKLREMLITNFPHEKKGIEEYFSEKNIKLAISAQQTYFLYNFTNQLPLINRLTKKLYLKNSEFRKITVQEKLDELFTDNNLKLLLLQSLVQVQKTSQCSYSFHLFMFDHLKDGAVYPAQGSEEFAKNALNIILRYNKSRILLNKKVEKILYDENKNKVYGVVLDNGQQIFAKNIIATNSYLMTMEKLLTINDEKIKKDIAELKKIVTITSSLTFAFVGNAKDLNLPTEMYQFQNTDNSNVAKSLDEILNSVKLKNQSENKCSCEIYLNCKYDIFEKWKNEQIKNRSKDYQAIKKQIADQLIENYLLKYFPQLKDKIDYIEIGTPLSCEHFLNYPTGSSYGFLNDNAKKEIANFKYLSYQSKIQGLFFAGQDISGGGLFQACLGGIFAASKVLGYMTLKDILTFRYFFKDLQNVIKQEKKEEKELKKKED